MDTYIFIQKYGFIAAAYTTLFAYICYMILHLVISYRLMRFSIIPVSCIALCLLSIVIIAIVDLIFIDNIFVRYLVCFAVVIIIQLAHLYVQHQQDDRPVQGNSFFELFQQNPNTAK